MRGIRSRDGISIARRRGKAGIRIGGGAGGGRSNLRPVPVDGIADLGRGIVGIR